MKVSFDFDSTLDRKDVQQFAKELVNDGVEVWIVTSRMSVEYAKANLDQFKINFLANQNFIFHLDDDSDELIAIFESKDSCQPINVNHFAWEQDCKLHIKQNKP